MRLIHKHVSWITLNVIFGGWIYLKVWYMDSKLDVGFGHFYRIKFLSAEISYFFFFVTGLWRIRIFLANGIICFFLCQFADYIVKVYIYFTTNLHSAFWIFPFKHNSWTNKNGNMKTGRAAFLKCIHSQG